MNFFTRCVNTDTVHITVDLKKPNHAMDIGLNQTTDITFKSKPPNFQ